MLGVVFSCVSCLLRALRSCILERSETQQTGDHNGRGFILTILKVELGVRLGGVDDGDEGARHFVLWSVAVVVMNAGVLKMWGPVYRISIVGRALKRRVS